ncbi:hypothetical protein E4S40_02340 [Algoriphagus kandeliae]|uniref:Uncharacterized protein n=1 Tax=Algoriphagus kandeliae TaxID=2562278 RepID=A0A4Y9R2L7_9BACT|nr:hypothetical protein [Algoriphagus kandeliae]TFV97515.1 hypothetical protein E4S40_02340 [Algoriphagus kandeliae]
MSYAWYFYGERNPSGFLPFFLKFEQACGFSRVLHLNEGGFNGIDFIRKKVSNSPYTFSLKPEHTLLSNQKSYGIYGKYNRPFTEIGIRKRDEFQQLIESSLESKVNGLPLRPLVDKLLKEDVITMDEDNLLLFAEMLRSVTEVEKLFYQKVLLEVDGDHVQNTLFNIFNTHPELTQVEGFQLYSFIDDLLALSDNESLNQRLIRIKHAEQILTPYAFLFRTLQDEPNWSRSKIEKMPIFNSFPPKLNYEFNDSVLDSLNASLQNPPFEIVKTAIERNKYISENRKNAPWLKEENGEVKVYYSDGAKTIESFDKDSDFENIYFFPTYISLYKQIML